jgi:hypothetical protein
MSTSPASMSMSSISPTISPPAQPPSQFRMP